jgi:alpha-amylase
MLATGLQPGTYCDLLTGGRDATGCKGQVLVVTTNGMAQVDISANSAIAVDIDSRR